MKHVGVWISPPLLGDAFFIQMLLAVAEGEGMVSSFVFHAILAAARWIFLAAIVLTMVYVFWNRFAASVLTIRDAGGAVAISAAFGAAWLTVLRGMPPTNAVSMLCAMLLPLLVSVLAPWSLTGLRHINKEYPRLGLTRFR